LNRVINFDFSQNLIEELAALLENDFIKKGKDISRVALIFGGHRPALFLKKELSRRIKNDFFPPRFFSMDEFVEYTLSKSGVFSNINDLEACFLIYNIAKTIAPDILKGRENFSQFLVWAKEILSFIEQMDLEAVEEKHLGNIQFNAEIGYDVPENINKLLQSLIKIRKAYHAALIEKNTFSRGLMYLRASEAAGFVGFEEFDHIIFCGFFYLSKAEKQLIKQLYQSQKAALIFHGNPAEWPAIADIYKALSLEHKQESPAWVAPDFSIYAGFDVHSQACIVREILKKIKNPGKTVVVLPEPENVLPLISEIHGFIGDFNVSMGYPLNRSSVYSLFKCIFRAQETMNKNDYYAKDYLAVLLHPLVKNLKVFRDESAVRVLVHKIEEVLLGMEKTTLGGSLFVKLEDISACSQLYDLTLKAMDRADINAGRVETKDALNQLHQILFMQWEDISSFGDFSLCLEAFLNTLVQKSHLQSYPLNVTMVDKIFSIADELSNASFKDERFSKDDIFRIFINKLDSEKIRFAGSPLKGLQVLGFFETRSLNFENVLIIDANESVLPSLKIYEPLIPREVMVGLGLNSLEKEEQIQRYQFRRLIAGASKVHIIYQDTPDKEKSRFVEELIWEKQKKSGSLNVIDAPRAIFNVKVIAPSIKIEKTPQVIEFLKGLEYSASSVNTYLHCPLRFYYQYVLGLKERAESLDEPEAADIGVFIHELFQQAFSVFLNKPVVIDSKFRKAFFDLLDKKFDSEFKKKMKSDAFLVKEILDVRMNSFLDNEAKRCAEEVLCLESTFKSRIEFKPGAFKFKAIVDRIDMLENKDILILDYKTGDTDVMPSTDVLGIEAAGFSRAVLKKSIKSFQLPLYYYLVANDNNYKDKEVDAALYFIKGPKENLRLEALFDCDLQPADKNIRMQVYMKALGAVLADIVSQDCAFVSDRENPIRCQWCPFFYLCR